MSFLTGSNNRFKFLFPASFVPESIAKRYAPLIKRLPDYPVDNVRDFLNLAIQGVQIPLGIQQTPVTQGDQGSRVQRQYRGNVSIHGLSEGTMTISMRLDEGYLVFFIMADICYYYYSHFGEKYLPEAFYLTFLDNRNLELYRLKFSEVLFTQVGQPPQLDYSSKAIDMQKIDCTFAVKKIKFVLENEEYEIPSEYDKDYVF